MLDTARSLLFYSSTFRLDLALRQMQYICESDLDYGKPLWKAEMSIQEFFWWYIFFSKSNKNVIFFTAKKCISTLNDGLGSSAQVDKNNDQHEHNSQGWQCHSKKFVLVFHEFFFSFFLFLGIFFHFSLQLPHFVLCKSTQAFWISPLKNSGYLPYLWQFTTVSMLRGRCFHMKHQVDLLAAWCCCSGLMTLT